MENIKNNRKDKQLLLTTIIFIILRVVLLILDYICYGLDFTWTGEAVIYIIIGFFVYYSYHTHNKNVMKPLLGAMLIMLLYISTDNGLYYLQYIKDNSEYYGTTFMIMSIIWVLIFVVLLLINIMHYVINSSHSSSPQKVLFNKILFFIFAALTIAQGVTDVICYIELNTDTYSTLNCVLDILTSLCMIIFIYIVIIIEGSLDEFRIKREAITKERDNISENTNI